ncbi:MAG: hypothetical protein OXC62_17640 [Aestuariivita sp.]|nr:hypothetical protein [Aestuariivita sp.]
MPRLPLDVELKAQGHERQRAVEHLTVLSAQDVVVYDRGDFSFAMLLEHVRRGLDGVFRLKSNAHSQPEAVLARDHDNMMIKVEPDRKARGFA